jgi:predicted aspartyl protease
MNIYKKYNLICTDIVLSFKGNKKLLTNVVIDTGAAQSIINSLVVEDINIVPESTEELATTWGIGGEMPFFTKVVDTITFADIEFNAFELDFGEIDPKGELSGLIGMDILEKARAVIDVEIPEISLK